MHVHAHMDAHTHAHLQVHTHSISEANLRANYLGSEYIHVQVLPQGLGNLPVRTCLQEFHPL